MNGLEIGAGAQAGGFDLLAHVPREQTSFNVQGAFQTMAELTRGG